MKLGYGYLPTAFGVKRGGVYHPALGGYVTGVDFVHYVLPHVVN
tara:strand:- start:82 stop:213 length:132 start_codon:yes stop_codon:yes gene_type:complete